MTTRLKPDPDEFVPVVLIATHRSLDALVASALAQRPEMRRSEARVKSSQARLDGVRKGPWLPLVGAQAAFGGLAGGRNRDFRGGDDFQDYGVSLSWRIGPGGIGDSSRIQSADSRLKLSELAREEERDAIVREVVEAQVHAQTAADRLIITARALEAARKLHDLTRSRKEFGVGAVLEAVDAERELTAVQMDHVSGIAAHNRAQWELWRSSGAEEPSFHRGSSAK